MAAVSRAGGVDREIRVVLDPAKMQALGVTASAINQALRQVNTDAAGGSAEIAGSRQSVRVLGNADTALRARQHPDQPRRRAHDPARPGRPCLRRLFRADLDRQAQRPAGGHLQHRARQGRVRRHRLRRGDRGDEEDPGREPRDPVHPALHQRRLHQGPVRDLDGSDGRRLDPRGHRGVPVPARLARDGRSRRWRSRCRRSRPSGSWTCSASR